MPDVIVFPIVSLYIKMSENINLQLMCRCPCSFLYSSVHTDTFYVAPSNAWEERAEKVKNCHEPFHI
jgi:hypothetical protein